MVGDLGGLGEPRFLEPLWKTFKGKWWVGAWLKCPSEAPTQSRALHSRLLELPEHKPRPQASLQILAFQLLFTHPFRHHFL